MSSCKTSGRLHSCLPASASCMSEVCAIKTAEVGDPFNALLGERLAMHGLDYDTFGWLALQSAAGMLRNACL